MAYENYFILNRKKTVSMVFRKRGKLAATNFICCDGTKIKTVKLFRYLSITLHTTGRSFKQYIKQRTMVAIRTMQDIEKLKLL
jgi:hypothetical protein